MICPFFSDIWKSVYNQTVGSNKTMASGIGPTLVVLLLLVAACLTDAVDSGSLLSYKGLVVTWCWLVDWFLNVLVNY